LYKAILKHCKTKSIVKQVFQFSFHKIISNLGKRPAIMIQSICFRLPRSKPVSYSPPPLSLSLYLTLKTRPTMHTHSSLAIYLPSLSLFVKQNRIYTPCVPVGLLLLLLHALCTLSLSLSFSLSLSLSLSLSVWQCVYETFRYRRVHTGRLPCITFSCVGSLHSKVDLLNRPLNFFCSNSFPRI